MLQSSFHSPVTKDKEMVGENFQQYNNQQMLRICIEIGS